MAPTRSRSANQHALRPRLARSRPALAGLLARALHGAVEAVEVDLEAARAQHVLGQVEREAVGIVELEGDIAGQRLVLAEPARRLVEQPQAAIERLLEAGLLELQRLDDQRLGARQLGIRSPHHLDQRRHEPVHQRLLAADDVRMAHRAAHDAAQDVAAPLVRRQHAVGDQKGRRAQVVGDHAVRDRVRAVGGHAARIRRGDDQAAQQVGVVVVVLALQHRGDALEPHAGVDRRLRQADALVRRQLLELHEDEVPDLDEAVAVLLGAARRPAREMRRRGRRRSRSTGRTARCRPSPRNCRRTRCG